MRRFHHRHAEIGKETVQLWQEPISIPQPLPMPLCEEPFNLRWNIHAGVRQAGDDRNSLPLRIVLYAYFHSFISGSLSRLSQSRLEGSGPEEKFHDVSFVRLQPIELDRRDGPQVQAVDVRRVYELALEALVVRNGGADERCSDSLQHLVLRAAHHAHEWKHEFSIGQRTIGRVAMDDHGPQVTASLFFHQPRAVFFRNVFDPRFTQAVLDATPD